jgi:hypothetical protein
VIRCVACNREFPTDAEAIWHVKNQHSRDAKPDELLRTTEVGKKRKSWWHKL